MTKPYVLVVDDEPDIRDLLEMTLARMELNCRKASSLSEAETLLKSDDYFLCLTDMQLGDGEGINLVSHIQRLYPQLPVAVITAYGNVEGAVNTLKAGAFDYVSKPINLKMLRNLVNTALTLSETEHEEDTGLLLGESAVMNELRTKIKKLARSQAPVFISGESGTGKELVANMIHQQGPRCGQPFIPVNCGAIPNELMESEFFGHKKGSFSGATTNKQGLFQAAHGGTLFLDEVAELPLHMQVKLLRAIQEKAVRPVGEQREEAVDVRVLSASHKNLQQLVEVNEFREDLFYRINVITLPVPPLRDRANDIMLLSNHILDKLAHQQQIAAPQLNNATCERLLQYDFPGNVRELENILERALTLSENNEITIDDLQLPQPVVEHINTAEVVASLDDTMHSQEQQVILAALEHSKWNRTAAAKALGISFRALRYRLKKYGLD